MQCFPYHDQRVLILAPHADDEVIGCGGIIQKYVKAKSPVRIIYGSFVYGSYHTFNKEKDKYENYEGERRWQELKQSLSMLGVSDIHILFTDLNDVQFHSRLDTIPRIEVVSKIEKQIMAYSPTIIYIPSRTKHQDHEALHEAAITATRPYFWNGSIIVYETDGEFCFHPQMYVPLTAKEINTKVHAMKSFQTQIGSNNHPTNPHFLRTKATYRGQVIYSDYAEAFQILRLHGL